MSLANRELIKCLLIAMLFLAVVGCREVSIVNDISQKEAVEISALLNQHGIDAQIVRSASSKGLYQVEVDKTHTAPAIGILKDQGYPRKSEADFSQLVTSRGLLPNSKEIENLKLERAQAIDLEELIKNHPGVANVRASIRLSQDSSAAYGYNPATQVAVVIQEKSAKLVDPALIAEMILKVVPGSTKESVNVNVHRASAAAMLSEGEGVYYDDGRVIRVALRPFLIWWRVPTRQYVSITLAFLLSILFVFVIGAVLGYWFGLTQYNKVFTDSDYPINSNKPTKSDKTKRDLLTGV